MQRHGNVVDSINKRIQELVKEYLVEWQTVGDYLRKINKNEKKLIKYADEARLRLGSDDYEDGQKMVSDILKHIEKLKIKFYIHRKESEQIRINIVKLNPYKKMRPCRTHSSSA